jgi:hypothetical protein
MSLLSNPWFSVGMGLLANSGPSLTPVNPWRGIGQGLMAASDAKAMEAQQAYEAQRMAMEQQKYAAEQARQRQMQSIIQSLPPDQQQLAMADPNAFFDARIKQQFAAPQDANLPAGWQMGADGRAQMIPGYQPEQKPQTSGIQLQGPNGAQYTALSVQDANEKLAQGFSYYKPPPSVQVNNEMGGGDRASPSDVANMIYPDGSQPRPGELWAEIIAKGGRTLTNEEKAAQTARGTQTAKNEEASGKGENVIGNYLQAAKKYQSGLLPYGSANSQALIARRNLVTFYAKNVLGTPGAEPSPALYDRAEEIIPDFGGPIDAALFDSRMAEIERGIAAALGGEGKDKKSQGMGDVEMVYDPKLKRLVPAK